MIYRRLLFPLLTILDSELSHHLALAALRAVQGLPPSHEVLRLFLGSPQGEAPVEVFGLRFPNRIGLAAGFDKNGVAVRSLAALGFGHVEVGTVTPLPQPGRPQPRMFRLKHDRALINRLGFPSLGMERVARNLERLAQRDFVLGINVGPNADSVGVDGFVRAASRLSPLADYVAVNVSSPNTTGLRDMQQRAELEALLAAVAPVVAKPLLLKIAPDLADSAVLDMVDVAREHGTAGIIATNTTIARTGLRGPVASETGGLSGAPLAARSNEVIRLIARHTSGQLPIIGVGGVASPADAQAKLDAGATLVQLYTGFVYEGPRLPGRIARSLR